MRHKGGLLFWIRRTLLVLVALLVGMCLFGAIYQVVATERDARTFPPPGQRMDLGGYQLHISCVGTGAPTVILDGASLDTVSGWHWVQNELAQTMQVCAYDRPGLGWSDLGPEPRDATQNAEQLHKLLAQAHIPGPYVLVGHSFGSLYARVYAGRYPDQVAGIVMIEGTHPDFLVRSGQPEVMPNADEGMLAAGPTAARLGLFRLMTFVPTDRNLPAQQQSELASYYATTTFADRMLSVFRQFPNLLAQARSVTSLGNMPLLVIIGGASDNAAGQMRQLQDDLLTLSSKSTQRVIEGATHISLVHDQEHAKATSAAIVEFVETLQKE